MSHGVLFIGYVIVATLLKKISKLNFKNFAIIQLASLIPFGTFMRKILRECLNSLKNIWLFYPILKMGY
jgi:integral membrane protein